MSFDMNNKTFTRTGSFRQQTMTERLANADTAVVAPNQNNNNKAANPFAIERPHATPSMLERQGSFRGFTQIGTASPFKRQMSLRINDLPSNAERQRAFLDPTSPHRTSVSPIPEVTATQPTDTVSQLCQELSQGLSLLTKNDADDFYLSKDTTQNLSTTVNSTSSIGPYLSMSTGASPADPVVATNPLASVFAPTILSTQPTATTTTLPPRSLTPNLGATTSSATAVVPVETASPLPNPEQWLGQIVKNVSPSPRRAPSIHARAKSLSAADPFDSEWVSDVAKPEIHSTNPFISPPKPPAQSFQVHL